MKESEFKVGQHVVYPLQGVGEIVDIEERDFHGKKIKYYNIFLKTSDMRVMIPVSKSEEIGIRAIVSSKKAMETISKISENTKQLPSDWKDRYRFNIELLEKGDICSFAQVVQALYNRSKVKELPVQERKLYDNALSLLVDETTYATGKEPDEVKKLIFTYLEK